MQQIIEKKFPKHLIKKSGLDRYVGDKKTRIIINYDPKSESGVMEVFEENLENDTAGELPNM